MKKPRSTPGQPVVTAIVKTSHGIHEVTLTGREILKLLKFPRWQLIPVKRHITDDVTPRHVRRSVTPSPEKKIIRYLFVHLVILSLCRWESLDESPCFRPDRSRQNSEWTWLIPLTEPGIIPYIWVIRPIAAAARSMTWTVFPCWNTEVVGSNPTRGTDVCAHLFCIYVILCAGSGLATGWSPVQGVLPTVSRIKKLKSDQGPKGCRTIESVCGL
jgi:hypothetical protein